MNQKTKTHESIGFIHAFDINKSFSTGTSKVNILNRVNFSITEGQFVIILGHSGSGKTTLLNLLSGLDKPDKGELFVMDHDITNMPKNELSKWRLINLGIVFQHFNLFPLMNIVDNVSVPLAFKGISQTQRQKRAKSLLKSFGLVNHFDLLPSELSGGEQQKVAIARAIINNPKIIIADEPTGELDSKQSKDILQLLRRLNSQNNTTIIMATNNSDYAHYADRVIHIFDGHVVGNEVKK